MTEQTLKPSNVVAFRSGETRSWFAVKASGDNKHVVEIYDEVGGWGVNAKDFIAELQAIDAEGSEVEFRLNSPGGDVFEGVAICSAIARMKAKTVAVVDGLAASIASLIAVSCDELKMPANAMLMIHAPWTMAMGSASELRETAAVLDKIEAQLVAAYDAKAMRTLGEREGAESFGVMVRAETWLTADEALALGLSNETLGAVKIAACIRADLAENFEDKSAIADFVISDAVEEVEIEIEAEEEEAETEAETAEEEIETEAEEAEEDEEVSDEIQAAIRGVCALAHMPDKADGFIAARATLDQVRAALFDAMADADDEVSTNSTVSASNEDEPVEKSHAQAMAEIRERQFARFNRKN